MYFTKTKFARSTVGATLLVALTLSTVAFAADSIEATLTNNERSAQDAIAYSPIYAGDAPSDSADATLAYSERAAQRVITNSSLDSEFANLRIRAVSSATGEATLMHNELSARHAIANAQASSPLADARRSSAALNSSPTNPSVAPR